MSTRVFRALAGLLAFHGMGAAPGLALADLPVGSPQPGGSWTVQRAGPECHLARQFQNGGRPFLLDITMGGGPEQFDLVMFGEGVPKVRPGSYYWLDLAARGQSRGFAALAGSAKSGGVLAVRDLSGRFLAELGTAQRIAMSVKGRPVFGVDVPEAVDAFRALQACYAGLLQEWEVDPARVVAPALGPATSFSDYPNPGSVFAQLLILPTPPDGSRLPVVPRAPTDWIGSLDYPSEALRQERGGTVVVVLSVDPSGAVGDCRVVVTSQFAPLDEQTCKQMRARARYPKSDSPTLRQAIERVRWVMPRL